MKPLNLKPLQFCSGYPCLTRNRHDTIPTGYGHWPNNSIEGTLSKQRSWILKRAAPPGHRHFINRNNRVQLVTLNAIHHDSYLESQQSFSNIISRRHSAQQLKTRSPSMLERPGSSPWTTFRSSCPWTWRRRWETRVTSSHLLSQWLRVGCPLTGPCRASHFLQMELYY